MPTYQYRCVDCGTPLEVVQKFTDNALTECPNCGGTLRKVFSAVGVVFKGSGFYATDNRSKGNSNSAADSGKRSDSGSSGADSSTGAAAAATKGEAAKPAGAGKSEAKKAAPSTGAPAA